MPKTNFISATAQKVIAAGREMVNKRKGRRLMRSALHHERKLAKLDYKANKSYLRTEQEAKTARTVARANAIASAAQNVFGGMRSAALTRTEPATNPETPKLPGANKGDTGRDEELYDDPGAY